jgi:putative hydrolase of the HAD superfamily
LLPGAVETLQWFRSSGCRTALLTNGAGPAQRRKIERFALEQWFDAICVEGELGFGKPDERIYTHALARLAVAPSNAWMVGDNLTWDIAPAQRLGLRAIWIDQRGNGLPDSAPCVPDRIVRALSELREG